MRIKPIALLSMSVLAIAFATSATPARAAEGDEKAVQEAAAHFYDALNAMFTGETALMSEVWSHADDVTFMGPTGGFLVGWKQVGDEWQSQAAMKLGGKVEPADMRITVGQDLAVVQNYERGVNTNFEGREQAVSIRATNVFRKENGQWKMIGHHTDLFSAPQSESSATARISD
jgi:ketosteroid isomerase-like protein